MKNKKKDWEIRIILLIVYTLLTIGILGVLLLDVIWKKGVYLIVIVLMMDILYERYYNQKNAKSNRN